MKFGIAGAGFSGVVIARAVAEAGHDAVVFETRDHVAGNCHTERDPETQVIGIAHADCEADAQILASMLRRSRPPKDILMVDYEPVTGSHVGPGALALFFLSNDKVRTI